MLGHKGLNGNHYCNKDLSSSLFKFIASMVVCHRGGGALMKNLVSVCR